MPAIQPNRDGPPLSRENEAGVKPYRGGIRREIPAVDQQSAFTSAGVHLALILLLWVGLPNWFHTEPPEPVVISIELPVSKNPSAPRSTQPIVHIPPKPPEPSKVDAPSTAPHTDPKQTDSRPAPTPPASPAPPQNNKATGTKASDQKIVKETDKPQPKIVKTPTPKPVDQKTPPKKDQKSSNDEDFQRLITGMEQEQKVKSEEKPSKKPVIATAIAQSDSENNAPLSASELGKLMGQLNHCWSLDSGSQGASGMKITIRAHYDQTGRLIGRPEYYDGTGSGPAFVAAKEAAIRAFSAPECTPLQGLDPKKYNTWKDLKVTFDPSALY